jgi:hypothetical protein
MLATLTCESDYPVAAASVMAARANHIFCPPDPQRQRLDHVSGSWNCDCGDVIFSPDGTSRQATHPQWNPVQ